MDLRITADLWIPASELRRRFSRSSGPGGQHVNSTGSGVELLFDLAACELLHPSLKARALARMATPLPRIQRQGVRTCRQGDLVFLVGAEGVEAEHIQLRSRAQPEPC